MASVFPGNSVLLLRTRHNSQEATMMVVWQKQRTVCIVPDDRTEQEKPTFVT